MRSRSFHTFLRGYYPGWFVSGGGGSGGAATVQTDGVTIQGDGSAGNKIAIKQVETLGTLTGAGTLASQLTIAGVPVDYFTNDNGQAGAFNPSGTNHLAIYGFQLPTQIAFGHMAVHIGTTDAVNLYSWGIYNPAGTLVAHTTPASYASNGYNSVACVEGTVTLNPGRYLFGFTGNAATLTIDFNNNLMTWFKNQSYTTSAGGAMPASITAPTLALAAAAAMFALLP